MRQTVPLHPVRMIRLLNILLLNSARTNAQRACGATQSKPIRVENAAGADVLRAAVNCTNGGAVRADWVSIVPVHSPIAVGEGTFLSVTGEDILSEVRGGGSATRLFQVSPGGSLTLTRFRVWGGSADGGGAIYSESATLTLDNCTFEGNVASDGNGGAVWAEGGNVTIVGGEFLANNATRYGGALYVAESRLVVQGGSRLQDNNAEMGGALFCGAEEEGTSKPSAFCSITDATFVSNSALKSEAWVEERDFLIEDSVVEISDIDGGGAAMFQSVSVEITDSVFTLNHATFSGGALHGGVDTNVSVNGCRFSNNTSENYGGAISAFSLTLAGSTQLVYNLAHHGGSVFGYNVNGRIVFSDVLCEHNAADYNGGCFYGSGRTIVDEGTVMLDNAGSYGGSAYAAEGSDVSVRGGTFTSRSCDWGGFIYAAGRTRVNITGGLFENNIVTRRGGVLYVNGEDESDIVIEGGTFRNNKAYEMGGAIAASGAPALVTITGGRFESNEARYHGGFVFLELEASFTCDGVAINSNSAGGQGGGVYARESTWVNTSCDFIANESHEGAAIYLTNVKSATFNNQKVADNVASGGIVVFVTGSAVIARNVTFKSSGNLQEQFFNRAVQLAGNTTLEAERCVFDDWLGDTVIFHQNSADGSLVLNSCDFSGSSAMSAVVSPNSDAEIRNAVVSNLTFANAVVNNSLALVDRALDCIDSNACGAGQCVDSLLGVLCECLEGGECLNDGGELLLSLKSPPDAVIYSPDTVSYELEISSAATGTTLKIWDLGFEGGGLELHVVPSSGVLHPGGSITISVTGVPSTPDVGGRVTNSFYVNSHSIATADIRLEVRMSLYLCSAYEYAMPVDGDDDHIVSCEQCASIRGNEGVACTTAGATQASLPILQGFWRSDPESMVIRQCLHPEACVGGTKISGSDDYCADGYKGPYCAVCTEGYGRSLSNACHSCHGIKARLLIVACAVSFSVLLLLLGLAVVFLIGGVDAVDLVRQSKRRKLTRMIKTFQCCPAVARRAWSTRKSPDTAGIHACEQTVVAQVGYTSGDRHGNNDGGADSGWGSTLQPPERYGPRLTRTQPLSAVAGVGGDANQPSDNHRHLPRHEATSTTRSAPRYSLTGTGMSGAMVHEQNDADTNGRVTSICCLISRRIHHWGKRLPLNKFRIVVEVWQILAVFSIITGAEFPSSYALFLSWINVLNFDIGYIFKASCILPSVNFYQRLLATTLGPFLVAAALLWTYRIANGRAGIGSAGVVAKRAARSRHLSAGLLITFMVFTSACSMVFNTFPCDDFAVDGESYLIADYSISCDTGLHSFFKAYAAVMVLVYPVGIPALYSVILWKHRDLLNPGIHAVGKPNFTGAAVRVTAASSAAGGGALYTTQTIASKGLSKTNTSPLELEELEERVKSRAEHPDLAPFMFLWRDFDPNMYYYEVIECGRRIFLTDVLIFIAPHTVTQAAIGCIFAFVNLLVFEMMRPHLDPTDSWLYRLGCVLIFLTMFLAMMIKMDVAGEGSRSIFAICLVALNVGLFFAVLWYTWRHMVDNSSKEGNTPT